MSVASPLAVAVLLAATTPAPAQGPTPLLPPHFSLEKLVSGMPRTIDFLPLPDGKLLAAEQPGRVTVWGADGQLAGQVIELFSEVSYFYDRGLMSLALHPGFVADGGPTSWIYLYYSAGPDTPNGQDDEPAIGRLTRYRVQESNGIPQAIHPSRQVLLGNRLPDGTCPDGVAILHESHMGAQLAFGRGRITKISNCR